MKRILLAVAQLLFLPFLAIYVLVAVLVRQRPNGITRSQRIGVVTPFGAGTRSGSARAERDLLEMLALDFEVTVIALPALQARPGFIGALIGSLVGPSLPADPRLADFLGDPASVVSEAKKVDLLFVEFVYAALFLFGPTRLHCSVILRDHEVLARRFAGELAAASSPADRFALFARLCTVWLVTLRLYSRADRIVALTPEDAAWLRSHFPFVGKKVVAIPVSFRADPLKEVMSPPQPRHLLYAANFYHKPNVDGLLWFLEECAPKIEPNVTLHLVGLDEPLRKATMPSTELTIVRHGHVEDIEAVCSDIPIALAPMISGGGIRIKNLLFGAFSKAIVTTSLANEGIGFEPGREAMVCDTAETFAAAINRLINDPDYTKSLGRNARSAVETRFSHDAIRARYSSEVFAH